jgi:hypothetical protein
LLCLPPAWLTLQPWWWRHLTVLWNIMPCNLVKVIQHFGGTSLGLLFDPEHGADMFLQNVNWLFPNYIALYSRK